MGLLVHFWLTELSGSYSAGYCNFYCALYFSLVKLIKQQDVWSKSLNLFPNYGWRN